MYLTGTGIELIRFCRDAVMRLHAKSEELTVDSMKIFQMGVKAASLKTVSKKGVKPDGFIKAMALV